MARNKKYRARKSNSQASKEETLARIDSLAKKAKQTKYHDKMSIKTTSTDQTLKVVGFIAVIIIVGGFVGYFTFFGSNNGTNINNNGGINPVQTNYLVCEHSNVGDHYHFTLEIYLNGELDNIPPDIGRKSCVYPIHTHDDVPNKIHIELPSSIKEHPSINDVFTVYKDSYSRASLSTNQLMGISGNVTATLNGKPLEDFLTYVPVDLDIVRIYVVS